jgi:hypothetical protein
VTEVFVVLEPNIAGLKFPKTFHAVASSEEIANKYIREYAKKRYGSEDEPTGLIVVAMTPLIGEKT